MPLLNKYAIHLRRSDKNVNFDPELKGDEIMKHLMLGFVGIFMLGCASMKTMESQDLSSAPSHVYKGDVETVAAATANVIQGLGYNVEKVAPIANGQSVYFSKSLSAFSWGEVGRVDVLSENATSSRVIVGSEKRYQLQLTGTNQNEFAEQIFDGLNKALAN